MAPATGQVEAISPSTAARQSMNRPEMGQAMEYIDAPPVYGMMWCVSTTTADNYASRLTCSVGGENGKRSAYEKHSWVSSRWMKQLHGVTPTWEATDIAQCQAKTGPEVIIPREFFLKTKRLQSLLLDCGFARS